MKKSDSSDEIGIESLINEIAKEFNLPITNKKQTKKILFDESWVALEAQEIIGTVGIIKLDNRNAMLKRMFVKRAFRGKEKGISKLLLQTAFNWCNFEKINSIYLGTMSQFKAAQKFYERNGFQRIGKMDLPVDFSNNPLDDVYFKKSYSLKYEIKL